MNKKNDYSFFANHDCRYYPCHKGIPEINCLFCYCPLYPFPDCGGNYTYSKAGTKICSDCKRPHIPENYDEIIIFLKEKYRLKDNKEDK